ncbi:MULTISPECIES: hypothetical protein [unclassified Xanthomonas]|uniref:hypothetical protein n=1 Tax=unclassified Xanthomonas TaxID=2643310 RepID=UPI002A7F5147|nr:MULTISPECIES: hypothetical protein [unclassified Xanthomonas]MDY4297024.1 hypothetical protein [Xanthomonas sp. LF02-5]MDY4359015.1 hypothetical protein [Xanthomonas sp. LF04-12]
MADDYLTEATHFLMQAGAFRSCIGTLIDEMDKTANGVPANFAYLPAYFLASHEMELQLKAALLKRGTRLQQLKGPDVGHNLEKQKGSDCTSFYARNGARLVSQAKLHRYTTQAKRRFTGIGLHTTRVNYQLGL